LLTEHREEILRICAKHGAGNVRVFGSMVRGDYTDDSDVDFLVDIVGPTTQWWPGGLIVDLEDLLGRKIDVTTEAGLNYLIKDQILAEAVPM
jgi:predicted nucleotidyltransferase